MQLTAKIFIILLLCVNLAHARNSEFGFDTGEVPADEVNVESDVFSGNLSVVDIDVQTALETIDGLTLGGTDPNLAEVLTAGNEGGGTDMVIDDADLHISNTSLADTAYSQTTEGVLLSGGGMNTTFKYTPGLWFGSTDPQLTSTNPKRLVGIIGEATESYGSDTDSGMKMHFMATPDNAGATPTPSILMTLLHDGTQGRLGIGTLLPNDELEVVSSSPAIRIKDTDGGASDSYFRLEASTSLGLIDYYGATDAVVRFSPRSVSGSGYVNMDFFRSTSTSGEVLMKVYLGDGSTDLNAQIGASGVDTYFCADNGNFGIGTVAPSSTLEVTGSFAVAYVAKTGAYTATSSDSTIECTANTFAITLPTAVGIQGRTYTIKNSGTGVISINTTSSQTVDGEASGDFTLNQYDSITVQSNNANWIII